MGHQGERAEWQLLTRSRQPEERQKLLARLFTKHRERLRRQVRFRLGRRLRARVDSSDVLQDVYIEISRRLGEYLANPPMPLGLWFRRVALEKVLELYRKHLGARRRDARREVRLESFAPTMTSSALLAEGIVEASGPAASTPEDLAQRRELHQRLDEALKRLDPLDLEVIALRHFEQLSNQEVASVLALDKSAASKRYIRALAKLKRVLQEHGGGRASVWP